MTEISKKQITLSKAEYDILRLQSNQLAIIRVLQDKGIIDKNDVRPASDMMTNTSDLDILVNRGQACPRVSGYQENGKQIPPYDPARFGLPVNDADLQHLSCDFKMPLACGKTPDVSGCLSVWTNDATQASFRDACSRALTHLQTKCGKGEDAFKTSGTIDVQSASGNK